MSLKDGKSNSTTYFDAYCDHILDAILNVDGLESKSILILLL